MPLSGGEATQPRAPSRGPTPVPVICLLAVYLPHWPAVRSA